MEQRHSHADAITTQGGVTQATSSLSICRLAGPPHCGEKCLSTWPPSGIARQTRHDDGPQPRHAPLWGLVRKRQLPGIRCACACAALNVSQGCQRLAPGRSPQTPSRQEPRCLALGVSQCAGLLRPQAPPQEGHTQGCSGATIYHLHRNTPWIMPHRVASNHACSALAPSVYLRREVREWRRRCTRPSAHPTVGASTRLRAFKTYGTLRLHMRCPTSMTTAHLCSQQCPGQGGATLCCLKGTARCLQTKEGVVGCGGDVVCGQK